MRSIKVLVSGLALAGFTAVSIWAQTPATQQPGPSAQPRQYATPPAPAPNTANAADAVPVRLRPVTGELKKKLDTKNAKPGDPVIVETTENSTTSDGIEIPKGSRIIGHVIQVQAHSKTNENSRLMLQFDQAQLKGGQTMPIRTVLESVAPAQVTVHPTDTLNAQPMGASPSSTGAAGSPGSTPPPGSRSTPPTAPGTPSVSPPTEQQASNAAPKTGTVVARQGNVAIMTTAIPGVLLAANANGQPFSNAAGALLGAKKDVHLDGGTQIVLAVMDAAPKPGTR